MNANKTDGRQRAKCLEDFAAELAEAAYPVALRRGLGSRWLDLELDLWKVLNETVQKWDRQARLTPFQGK